MKRKIKARGKGQSFERLICKSLSSWVTDGQRDDVFWRTAMSGGRATIQRKAGRTARAQEGDVGAISYEGLWLVKNFVIECKHVKNLKLLEFMIHARGPAHKFWDKLCGQCHQGQEPLMIARQNRYPTLMFTTSFGAERLGYHRWRQTAMGQKRGGYPVRVGYVAQAYVYVFRFDDFLEHIDYPHDESSHK